MAEKLAKFVYHEIELYKSESLGSGSYGGVCKAKCDGLLCAAKIMHPTLFDLRDPGTASYLCKFREECHLLSLARHPNVVQYLGTYTDPDTRLPVLLMELCDESLTAFLERSPGPLSYHIQVNMAHDIALALVYLHSNGVIHRDLTGNNVLMIAGLRAKITDFGMSKLASVNPRMTALTLCPGNVLYMSPEALESAKSYTTKLDIFSFGVLAIQILTQLFPNPTDRLKKIHIEGLEEVRVVVPDTERRKAHLKLIPDTHALKPLALQCLKKENERPSAIQVSERIVKFKQSSQYIKSMDLAQNRMQKLELELQQQKIFTEVRESEIKECRTQIAWLASEMEKQVREHSSQRASWDQAFESKNKELYDMQVNLQSSERLAVDLQQSLQHRDQTITELHRTISDHERKIQQLQEQRDRASRAQPVPESLATPQNTVALTRNEIGNMRWREGKDAPMRMWRGAVVVRATTAYLRPGNSRCVLSYQHTPGGGGGGGEEWGSFPDVPNGSGGLVVVRDLLTNVGGRNNGVPTNALLSLTQEGTRKEWTELFPPMPTRRRSTACVATSQSLVVAGGYGLSNHLGTVEVLNLDARQWVAVASLPQKCSSLSAVVCGDTLYLAGGITENCFSKSVFACSLPDLVPPASLGSRIPSSYWLRSKWQEVCSVSVTRSSLVLFGGDLLAIGGRDDSDNPSSSVYRYDSQVNTWTLASRTKNRRSACLAAALSEDCLVVVGGFTSKNFCSNSATNSAEMLKLEPILPTSVNM